MALIELFEAEFLLEHIHPLAIILSADKVAEVRSSANFLVSSKVMDFKY